MGQKDTAEFTLTDAWGVEHSYLVSYHGASEGLEIVAKLGALVAPSLGKLVSALSDGDGLSAVLDASFKATDLEGMLKLLDWSLVAGELKLALMDPALVPLVKRILRHTVRGKTPLEMGFDQAYRANYAELYKAVWEVIRINGFFGGLSTSMTG